MTSEGKSIFDAALKLSVSERAELAATLIESLEEREDENVAQAWEQELAARLSEINQGRARMVPWEEVRRCILGGAQ